MMKFNRKVYKQIAKKLMYIKNKPNSKNKTKSKFNRYIKMKTTKLDVISQIPQMFTIISK